MIAPLCRHLRRMMRADKGATAVEYGLILAIVVLGALGAIVSFADVTIGMWNNVESEVAAAS